MWMMSKVMMMMMYRWNHINPIHIGAMMAVYLSLLLEPNHKVRVLSDVQHLMPRPGRSRSDKQNWVNLTIFPCLDAITALAIVILPQPDRLQRSLTPHRDIIILAPYPMPPLSYSRTISQALLEQTPRKTCGRLASCYLYFSPVVYPSWILLNRGYK